MLYPARAFVLLALAGVLGAEDKWVRVQTDNFEVFTSQGERKAKETALYFEQLREFFLYYWQVKADPATPVRIIVFSGEKQYAPFQPGKHAAGYFQHGIDRPWIVIGGHLSGWERTICHEYTHLMVQQSGLSIPLWLNEGLAEIYSTFRPMGSKVEIGNLIPGHFAAVQNGWIPVSRLLEVRHADPEYRGKQSAQFYAGAWGLTHMLMLERQNRRSYAPILEQLAKGVASEEAIAAAGFTTKRLDDDLRIYLKRNDQFYAGLIPFKSERSSAAWKSSVVPAVEMEAVLALLTVNGADAGPRLSKLDPGNAASQEALAYAAWRKGDMPEARQHFTEAIRLGAASAKLYYDAARASMYARSKDDESIGWLQRAVEVYPEWLEARLQLLEQFVFLNRYADALRLSASFKAVPARHASRLFRSISYTEAMLKSLERAEQSRQRARSYAKTERDSMECDRLDQFLDRLVAAKENAAQMTEQLAAEMREARLRADAAESNSFGPAPADDDDDDVPVIRRKSALPPPEIDAFEAMRPSGGEEVEASLVHMDCSRSAPLLEFRLADSSVLKLEILDPQKVNLHMVKPGEETKVVELQCGAQERRVRIGHAQGATGFD